ncbi:sodium:proton antiporter [Candidatus Poribacteria bacterium]|nr:sodium:proton antiporter [Candidatus Poribacteria bacterium]MYK95830.1 sodium:proton antiporter [Candidatus Poribacteria bacterium]
MKFKLVSCLIICVIIGLALSVSMEAFGADDAHHGHGVDGAKLPIWSIIPFVGILLSIAIFPLVFDSHFLVHHGGKMSLVWASAFAIPYLIAFRGAAFYDILHIYLLDYIPFILLLWGLFTVAGGILVRGTLRGTPILNTFLLLIGTVIASWVGTTGASMLLIRPLIRANAYRKNKVHLIVFFIFLVSNIGGSLTPIGDPPLFLGFLRGVPFFWTTTALFPHMLLISVVLLILFFIFDTLMFKREGGVVPDDGTNEPVRVEGLFNLVFLFGIIAAVLMSGTFKWGEVNILGVHVYWQNIAREVLIIVMGLLSLKYTPFRGELRQSNEFSWEPIEEVAKVFAGIFMTIIPALAILKAGEGGALAGLIGAMQQPYHYFWITGVLSSFLDNAPTYLTFFNTALGKLHLTEAVVPEILSMPYDQLANQSHQEFVRLLVAISVGAVFMGANTYIGNAPNFMVKAIAEQSGIRMPSFFGYMLWSVAILFPLFVVVTFVFLR